MKQPLAGLVVVVTRPARQAARFIGMLTERGAATVAFPTVAIEPVPLGDDVRAALAAQPIDWVIYTSANAVEQALAQTGRLARAATAAIGRATARAVGRCGDSRRRHSRDRRGFRGLARAPCVRRTLGPAHRDLQGRRWTRRAPRRARASRCSGCRRRGLPPPAGRSGRRFACRNCPTPAPPHRPWSQSRVSRYWSRCSSSHPSHGYRTSRTRPCSCPANALRRRHASTAGAGRSSWPEVPRTR